MFDIAHVNTFMDLVSNPDKYAAYVKELTDRTAAWKDTLGASDTLAKANSRLSHAEVILAEANGKADKIVEKAKKMEEANKQTALKLTTQQKTLEQRERDVATTGKAALELRAKAEEVFQSAKDKETKVSIYLDELKNEKAKCVALQLELNSRLDKIKAVMT
jgi:chromosome segregation ATPase